MVLTDPEFESSVLISSDEGASYQKYRLTFYVLSLLFHPTEEDWALAYSHDQKVRLCLMSHFAGSSDITLWDFKQLALKELGLHNFLSFFFFNHLCTVCILPNTFKHILMWELVASPSRKGFQRNFLEIIAPFKPLWNAVHVTGNFILHICEITILSVENCTIFVCSANRLSTHQNTLGVELFNWKRTKALLIRVYTLALFWTGSFCLNRASGAACQCVWASAFISDIMVYIMVYNGNNISP